MAAIGSSVKDFPRPGSELALSKTRSFCTLRAARFIDLLRKNLRGAGGDKTFLSLGGTFRPLDLFKVQFRNFLHRQRLISDRAKTLELTPFRLIKVRGLLTLFYIGRFVESTRLILGGKPHRL